ncbi:MAG: protein translocase subunit SecD [Acidimicrobiales bacterium]|nr:protein translocase subunit SecD [Acidimicrobiales bacterium]
MLKRLKGFISLIVVVALVVGGLTYTFVAGNAPLLGLDLQGGLSVVLKPKREVPRDQLEQSIAIIRNRVDAIGVAEPEISTQGQNILVQIPGVKDQERALQLVGTTAEVRFRPVLQVYNGPFVSDTAPPSQEAPETTDDTTSGGTTPEGTTPEASTPGSTGPPPVSVEPSTPPTSEVGLGLTEGEFAAGAQPADPPASEVPAPSTLPASEPSQPSPSEPDAGPTEPQQLDPNNLPPELQQQLGQLGGGPGAAPEITPPDQDLPDQTVVLPEYDNPNDPRNRVEIRRYRLGPVELTGDSLSGASAAIDPQTGQWKVRPVFKGGADGIDKFNAAAAKCKPPSSTCPTGAIAIVLDGKVISAPQIQPNSAAFTPFSADSIEISGSFTERDAKDLALVLRYGALPVELELQQVQVVSATLGKDALSAALAAGVVAAIVVALYMMLFYRILGLAALVKLAVEGSLLWTLIAWMGSSQGLALTLAGVTGIIVSIGVSLDSNVVYYEHIRESLRRGRTLRSAVDKAFDTSFSTIVKADGTSAIGAMLLYWLSVGPVRGFALMLGVSTALDLIASYFFMRPMVKLVTRTRLAIDKPTWFGLPRPEDVDQSALATAVKKTQGAAATRHETRETSEARA